jgi:hypothetical protein
LDYFNVYKFGLRIIILIATLIPKPEVRWGEADQVIINRQPLGMDVLLNLLD